MSAELTDEQVERAMIRLNGSVTVKAGWRVYRAAMREAISEALATPPPEPDDRVEAAYWDGRSDERKRWEPQGTPRTPEQAEDIPRRIRIDRMTPAETAIRSAVEEVEKLPPDTRLTDAVTLLADAQRKVADYVDGVQGEPEQASYCPRCTQEMDHYSVTHCPSCDVSVGGPPPSEQAHGDALAAQDTNLKSVALSLRNTGYGLAPQFREQLAGIIDDVRRHLTASGVPYIPEEVRRLVDYFSGMSEQLPQSPDSAKAWAQASHMLQTALASASAVPELSHKTAMQLVEVFDNYEDERGPGTLGRRAESMQAAWHFVHRAAAPTDGRES